MLAGRATNGVLPVRLDVALPVQFGTDVVAVLRFLLSSERPPEKPLLYASELIGTELGRAYL